MTAWYEDSTATLHIARYTSGDRGGNYGIPQRVDKEIAAAKQHGWAATAIEAKRQWRISIWTWIPVILLFPIGPLFLLLPIFRPKCYTVRFERDSQADPAQLKPPEQIAAPRSSMEAGQTTADELRALKSLLDEELITQAEYEEKRQTLVERL